MCHSTLHSGSAALDKAMPILMVMFVQLLGSLLPAVSCAPRPSGTTASINPLALINTARHLPLAAVTDNPESGPCTRETCHAHCRRLQYVASRCEGAGPQVGTGTCTCKQAAPAGVKGRSLRNWMTALQAMAGEGGLHASETHHKSVIVNQNNINLMINGNKKPPQRPLPTTTAAVDTDIDWEPVTDADGDDPCLDPPHNNGANRHSNVNARRRGHKGERSKREEPPWNYDLDPCSSL